MLSLIDLEQDRDRIVEGLMLMLESDEPEETLAALDELEAKIAGKADAIAAVHASKKGEIAYLKERISAYQDKLTIKENALKRFEGYVKGILERREDPKIIGKSSQLALVKNGGKAPLWVDELMPIEAFPEDLVIKKVVQSLDKDAIRAALDADGDLKIDGKLIAQELPRTFRLKIG
jgi:Siphovirus Gp157